jgi:serine/threonine-protein kinase
MNRRVAVKELSMPAGMTPQQLEDRISRFRREAQAVGSLNHPNIMTVYSFSEDQGRYFMAMEFLDGITLRKEIDNNGFLSQDRAIEIISETLSGLAHAHDAGVVHRDIKPDNIQIISSGTVKITDFGIARLTFQPNLTMDGQVFGTPSYMSPEQVVGKEIDNRTDLFSVGVMLYEMLTGNKPFQGDNVIAITHAIVNTIPNRPPNIDFNIWKVIERSLEKAPQMRYHNANEMRVALEESAAPQPQQQTYGSAPAGFDPYAQPPMGLVPPPQNPYSQPYQQTYQQPYGVQRTPYGGTIPQSSYNPYGTPPPVISNMPPPVIVQPPTYGQGTYSPYAQPNPGQPMAGNPQPYNAYYPPPPGPPMFSAASREKIRHFFSALFILGILAAIIVLAFITIANNVSAPGVGQQPKKTAAEKAPQPSQAPDNVPANPTLPNQASQEPTPKATERKPTLDPSGNWHFENAKNATDPQKKIASLRMAFKAYFEENNISAAEACGWEIYNLQLQTNASKRELRETLRDIIGVAVTGSQSQRQAQSDLAALE